MLKEMAEAEGKRPVSSAGDCSAGVPPAVAGASRPRFGEVTIRDRGRLPHSRDSWGFLAKRIL